jgi:putative protease
LTLYNRFHEFVQVELLSPAGDFEKLETVYRYGADAAYIGLAGFSLRPRANDLTIDPSLEENLRRIKGNKRLYGALNIYFRDADIARLEEQLESIARLPLDAVIVADIGVVPLLHKHLPDVALHLSTQTNCLNVPAARLYQEIGFSRIIAAREMSLADLETLKSRLPDLEVEVFVHGAMCLAYSGRCLLSAWSVGRSANEGECAHSCRWEYRLALEEAQRPGQYLPVEEGPDFTTLLSPKDLCMIDHLRRLADAGIDAVKIEGRMKSAYYAAIVTRAYRKEIDRIEGYATVSDSEAARYRADLDNVSHRDYSTGFYFGDPDAIVPTRTSYRQSYRFVGTILKPLGDNRYGLRVKNAFSVNDTIEYVGPDLPSAVDKEFLLYDEKGVPVDSVSHHSGGIIEPSVSVAEGYLIRMARADDKVQGSDGNKDLKSGHSAE